MISFRTVADRAGPTVSGSAKRAAKAAFLAADRVGVHLLPRHYYSPVANRADLRAAAPTWQDRATLPGIDLDPEAQLAWLRGVAARGNELQLATYTELLERRWGPGFGPLEAQILHGVVRTLQPERILEVGAGISTDVMVRAGRWNAIEAGTSPHITTVDPYPTPHLRQLAAQGDIDLVVEPAHGVLRDLAAELTAGDVLFIDSTHAVRTGSEVPLLYIDVLPALVPGVRVHVHDVYLPFLYSPTVLREPWDWQETTLLAALLTHNPRLAVRCVTSLLHHDRPESLRDLFPEYRPARLDGGLAPDGRLVGHYPVSTWLEVVAPGAG